MNTTLTVTAALLLSACGGPAFSSSNDKDDASSDASGDKDDASCCDTSPEVQTDSSVVAPIDSGSSPNDVSVDTSQDGSTSSSDSSALFEAGDSSGVTPSTPNTQPCACSILGLAGTCGDAGDWIVYECGSCVPTECAINSATASGTSYCCPSS